MSEEVSDNGLRGRLVALMASVLVGILAVGEVACDRNGGEEPEADPTPASETPEQRETAATGGEQASSKRGAAEQKGVLPGDEKAGTVEPTSPGPDAPAIFFMTGQKGYLEPCGCTADVLLGGAERIVGYVEAARKLYPDTTMLNGGDLFFERRELEEHQKPQARAKSEVVAAMQREMGTSVLVPGERDFTLGTEVFFNRVETSGAEILAENLDIAGRQFPGSKTVELGDWQVGVIGAVQSDLYTEIEGVEATDAEPAVGSALDELPGGKVDATVLLLHGDLARAKELLRAHAEIDFVVIGHGPRETDQVDVVNNGHTLEAYDQGRYVGILKLFGRDRQRPFRDARTGSESELEQIDNQIEHVEDSLDKLPPASDGEAPPILKRLRDRLDNLEERRREIKNGDLEVPETHRGFLYRPVPMKPGFPVDDKIREQRVEFNAHLEELSRQVDREVPPVPDGEATFVGTNQCADCHQAAHDFWKDTRHAHAIETLQERDKAFDQDCVGCHVVGYGEPGGSVLGKLEYEEKIGGETLTKDLRDVGCETCHGPGSKHRAQPVGSDGEPQYIESGSGKSVCADCHVKGHSPGFNYETYVDQITGEGHERRSSGSE
jgi:hypothetical protein